MKITYDTVYNTAPLRSMPRPFVLFTYPSALCNLSDLIADMRLSRGNTSCTVQLGLDKISVNNYVCAHV